MKIALCLYGLVGGTVGKDGKGGEVDYNIAYEHYKKHILDKNDVDVFIHSWSIDYKKELNEIYKPKKSVIEKQIDFKKQIKRNISYQFNNSMNCLKNYVKKIIKKGTVSNYNYLGVVYRTYSRWYSNKRVLELKKEYEIDNGFVYDWVMVTRLDLAFFTDVVFNRFDPCYFYASYWNDAPNKDNDYKANRVNHYKRKGFLDLWFFSNSEMMDKFSTLYVHRKNYDISPHISSRQHVDTFTDKIRYVFYRWEDYEMVRRKFLGSDK